VLIVEATRRLSRLGGVVAHVLGDLQRVMVELVPIIQPSIRAGAYGEMDPRDKPEDDRVCGE
jgi:hypothetical protein